MAVCMSWARDCGFREFAVAELPLGLGCGFSAAQGDVPQHRPVGARVTAHALAMAPPRPHDQLRVGIEARNRAPCQSQVRVFLPVRERAAALNVGGQVRQCDPRAVAHDRPNTLLAHRSKALGHGAGDLFAE